MAQTLQKIFLQSIDIIQKNFLKELKTVVHFSIFYTKKFSQYFSQYIFQYIKRATRYKVSIEKMLEENFLQRFSTHFRWSIQQLRLSRSTQCQERSDSGYQELLEKSAVNSLRDSTNSIENISIVYRHHIENFSKGTQNRSTFQYILY